MKTHALASTTLTCSPSVSGHFTHYGFSLCTSCRQFNCCRCTYLFNFLTYTRIPFRDSHCENGSFEVSSLHFLQAILPMGDHECVFQEKPPILQSCPKVLFFWRGGTRGLTRVGIPSQALFVILEPLACALVSALRPRVVGLCHSWHSGECVQKPCCCHSRR